MEDDVLLELFTYHAPTENQKKQYEETCASDCWMPTCDHADAGFCIVPALLAFADRVLEGAAGLARQHGCLADDVIAVIRACKQEPDGKEMET